MGKKDARVDAYIAKAPAYAAPILRRLRKLVHQGCPAVVEEIKWGVPHFNYGGMFCGMAAFKEHCTFGFWNRAMNIERNEEAKGHFGRITALSDLPADGTILGYVEQAKELTDKGGKLAPERRARKPLNAALKKEAGAHAKFKAFSPSQQRDYSERIGEAKTDATRDKRLATAVGWIAEGKSRNWKYERPSRSMKGQP